MVFNELTRKQEQETHTSDINENTGSKYTRANKRNLIR